MIHEHSVSALVTALTCSVGVTVEVQASPGYRLAAKQRIAVKVVAEFFQEAQNVCDTAHCRQGQGVLLLVNVGWIGHIRREQMLFNKVELFFCNNTNLF